MPPTARTEFNDVNNIPVRKKYRLFLRMGRVVFMDPKFIFANNAPVYSQAMDSEQSMERIANAIEVSSSPNDSRVGNSQLKNTTTSMK